MRKYCLVHKKYLFRHFKDPLRQSSLFQRLIVEMLRILNFIYGFKDFVTIKIFVRVFYLIAPGCCILHYFRAQNYLNQ